MIRRIAHNRNRNPPRIADNRYFSPHTRFEHADGQKAVESLDGSMHERMHFSALLLDDARIQGGSDQGSRYLLGKISRESANFGRDRFPVALRKIPPKAVFGFFRRRGRQQKSGAPNLILIVEADTNRQFKNRRRLPLVSKSLPLPFLADVFCLAGIGHFVAPLSFFNRLGRKNPFPDHDAPTLPSCDIITHYQ